MRRRRTRDWHDPRFMKLAPPIREGHVWLNGAFVPLWWIEAKEREKMADHDALPESLREEYTH